MRFEAVRTIHAIGKFIGILAVDRALAVLDRRGEVAIAVVVRLVGIIAVLAVAHEHAHVRDLHHELPKLHEERAREVVVASVLNGIPLIRPPVRGTVDLVRLIRRVDRNDGLVTVIAGALVECLLISKCEAPLLAAMRAKRWWRERIFLPRDDW